MPPRKSTRSSTGATKGQSTLAFNNRVTKNVPKSAKDSVISSSVTKKATPTKPEVDTVEIEEPETIQQEITAVADRSDVEVRAAKISDAQIKKYWKGVEGLRKAPRVHQSGLSLSEKVLRYFDVSSKYGPCIGIPRMKRFQRAQKMGLNPPIEVLAVLLKEEEQGNKATQRAAMDSIMASTAVGSL